MARIKRTMKKAANEIKDSGDFVKVRAKKALEPLKLLKQAILGFYARHGPRTYSNEMPYLSPEDDNLLNDYIDMLIEENRLAEVVIRSPSDRTFGDPALNRLLRLMLAEELDFQTQIDLVEERRLAEADRLAGNHHPVAEIDPSVEEHRRLTEARLNEAAGPEPLPARTGHWYTPEASTPARRSYAMPLLEDCPESDDEGIPESPVLPPQAYAMPSVEDDFESSDED